MPTHGFVSRPKGAFEYRTSFIIEGRSLGGSVVETVFTREEAVHYAQQMLAWADQTNPRSEPRWARTRTILQPSGRVQRAGKP